MSTSKLSIIILFTIFLLISNTVLAQETKTLMGLDTKISTIWGINLKTGSIQNDIGIGFDVFYGALFNRSILLGNVAGLNVSHPLINYGYLGFLGQYTYKPDEVIHFSGQLVLDGGTAKGYQSVKSGVLDNFGNITGTEFYYVEPGLNIEFNLTFKTRLVMGLSYRYVTGLDEVSFTQEDYETNESEDYTFYDTDLSILFFNVGVKIGKY